MATDQQEKLWKMIEKMKVGMMTTAEADGSMRSRPMWSLRDGQDECLWFFTHASSGKTDEIDRDRHVNLSFADPGDNDYVSVSGRAVLVRDPAKIKALWKEPFRTWFPKGTDDPDIALLKVEIDKAEYWDSPSATMVHLYGYVKARLTGESPQGGEHAQVKMA